MDFLNSIEEAIIMYAPVLLVYITQIVDWIVTLKKFKNLNVADQVKPVLTQVSTVCNEIKDLNAKVEEFTNEKADLKTAIDELKVTLSEKDAEIAEIKEFLKNLSTENVELKAELRRKSECVAKEPLNV